MVASRVRCRGGIRRCSLRRSRNRSSRWSRICAGLSERTRAAASSIASGIPSSRRAISAIVRGHGRPARSTGRRRRPVPRTAVRAVEVGPSASSGGTGSHCSPSTPSGSRLVASTRSAGAASSSRSTRARVGSSRCSQLSTTSSAFRSGQVVRDAHLRRSVRFHLQVEAAQEGGDDLVGRRWPASDRRRRRRRRSAAARAPRPRPRPGSCPLRRGRGASRAGQAETRPWMRPMSCPRPTNDVRCEGSVVT